MRRKKVIEDIVIFSSVFWMEGIWKGWKWRENLQNFKFVFIFLWKGKLLYSCIEQIGKCTHFPLTISPFWRNWFLVAQEIFFPFTFISLHFLFVFQIKEKLYSTLNFLAPRKPPPPTPPKKKKKHTVTSRC